MATIRINDAQKINVHGPEAPARSGYLGARQPTPGGADFCLEWEGTVDEILALLRTTASSPRPAPGRAPARVVFRPASTSAIPTTTSSSSPCTTAGPDVPSRLSFRGAPRSARQLHTDVRRHIDRNEPVTRVQIILPALVDDSEVATFQGASVSDHSIDLVELEGRRGLRIVDTEDEAGAGLRPALDEPRRHTNASVALRQAQAVLGEV